MLDCSWGYWKDKTLIGACLLSYWKDRESPLLNCIAVKNAWKSRNVSSALFQKSIFSLIEAGQVKVYASISENNLLPMHLAERIGFTAIK
jgi:N-acetylglutamate synthase-like GNAT family acetyltransferase